MLNEVIRIVSSFNILSSQKTPLVCHYLIGVMVACNKHSLESIAKMADCHPSRFSVLLNNPESLEEINQIFNRAVRRVLAKIKAKKGKTFIIIDATFTKRSSKHVENSKIYHSGSGYVRGHKWLNIILHHNQKIIPLASIPLYSKDFCKKYGIVYRTEPEVVTQWILGLPETDLFTNEDLKNICFLADSGYDVKKIQKSILKIGSHFVIALKSSRTIKDHSVAKYFKRYKKGHSSSTIRFKGSGKKRITFQVRLAMKVHHKGVGLINVACSQGKRGSKKTIKYVASSDLRLKARDIVKYYRARWSIETWHKEVKQNFGFGDCACKAFNAVQTHVQLVITAYLLRPLIGSVSKNIEDYQSKKLLSTVRIRLTQIGQVKQAQTIISEALQKISA